MLCVFTKESVSLTGASDGDVVSSKHRSSQLGSLHQNPSSLLNRRLDLDLTDMSYNEHYRLKKGKTQVNAGDSECKKWVDWPATQRR